MFCASFKSQGRHGIERTSTARLRAGIFFSHASIDLKLALNAKFKSLLHSDNVYNAPQDWRLCVKTARPAPPPVTGSVKPERGGLLYNVRYHANAPARCTPNTLSTYGAPRSRRIVPCCPATPLHSPTHPPSDTQKGPPAGALPAGQTLKPDEHKGWVNSSLAFLSGPTLCAEAETNAGRILVSATTLFIVATNKATMQTAEVHDM
ncbi:unnamed protein product [Pleuronectes platessa]|uniref:Uncharacterized protein n=1 Tax=Pleuronectes platessa TaxID=8262 RepID=A0A9N7UUM0_PLEPL|nr:unnamed protein product [Pleuronectes platessa]